MADRREERYLAFGIDGDTYAVPVGKVREVLEYIRPTKLPNAADYLKGIVNVRGAGIPLVDLRVCLGLPEIQATKSSSILVLEAMDEEGEALVLGALTDEVHEVVDLYTDEMEEAPRFGGRIDMDFVKAIGRRDERFVVVLDIDALFSREAASMRGKITATV